MSKPPVCIGLCAGGQDSCDGPVEGLTRARLGFAQRRRDLGPPGREGRHVRRVRRPGQPPSSTPGERLLNPHGVVRPHIVPHHDGARRPWRSQHPLDVGTKDRGVGRPVDGHDRVPAVDAQRSHDGDIRAVGLGYAPDHPLPCGSAAIEARHRAVQARCIHARHAREVERWDPLLVDRPRLLDARGLACRRGARLLLRGSPRRCSTRHLVGPLPRTPRSAATRGHHSSRVASGWSAPDRRTTAWAAAARRGF